MSEQPGGRAGAAALKLASSTVVAAGLGWATLIVVARLAGPGDYTSFAVLWSIYYGVAGILAGLQQEVTRTVASIARAPGLSMGRRRPVVIGAALGACVAALTGAALVATGATTGATPAAALGLSTGLLGLTGLVLCLGVLAAEGRWSLMVVLIVLDASVRLGGVTVVVMLEAPLWLLMAIVGGASWVWLPFAGVVFTGSQDAPALEAHPGKWSFARRAVALMASTGLASLVIAGLPWMFAVSRGGTNPADAGLLASLVLFRSPLLAAVNGLRPLMLRRYVGDQNDISASAHRAWALYATAAVPVCCVAGAFGPWVLSAVFGEGFGIDRVAAAGLTMSAVLLVMVTHGGVALVALEQHQRVLQGWCLAALVTAGLLLLPVPGPIALVIAALGGPCAALVWQFQGLRQSKPMENADSRS